MEERWYTLTLRKGKKDEQGDVLGERQFTLGSRDLFDHKFLGRTVMDLVPRSEVSDEERSAHKPTDESLWMLPKGTIYRDLSTDIMWPSPLVCLDEDTQVVVVPQQDPDEPDLQVIPYAWVGQLIVERPGRNPYEDLFTWWEIEPFEWSRQAKKV